MIALCLSAVVGGVVLVRIGWSRGGAVAPLGWVIVAAALAVLGGTDGAWGLTIGTTAAMVAALTVLLWAAWTTPGMPRRADRTRLVTPPPPEPVGWARRVAVFLLVVPVGGAAVLWLAFGAQAAARRAGMGAADATACLLFLLPLLWCGLLTWQMTRAGPRGMVAPPVAAALLGSVLWAAR